MNLMLELCSAWLSHKRKFGICKAVDQVVASWFTRFLCLLEMWELWSFSVKEGSYQIMCNNDDKSQDFFMNRLLKLF